MQPSARQLSKPRAGRFEFPFLHDPAAGERTSPATFPRREAYSFNNHRGLHREEVQIRILKSLAATRFDPLVLRNFMNYFQAY